MPTTAYIIRFTPGAGGNLATQAAYLGNQQVDGSNKLNQSATHEAITIHSDCPACVSYYKISVPDDMNLVFDVSVPPSAMLFPALVSPFPNVRGFSYVNTTVDASVSLPSASTVKRG